MNQIARNQLGYRKPLSETFWAYVKKTETCWLWNKSFQSRYGLTSKRNPDGSRTLLCAHRRSWEIHYGEIPKGMLVLHKCDVSLCVNPEHLFLGTQKDNMVDKCKKGRQARGEKNGWAKMTAEKVLEMRRLHKLKIPLKQIQSKFDISMSGLHDILYGKNWQHI